MNSLWGKPCQSSGDCRHSSRDFACIRQHCIKEPGYTKSKLGTACSADRWCESGLCQNNICQPKFKVQGTKCSAHHECTSNFCEPGSGVCHKEITGKECNPNNKKQDCQTNDNSEKNVGDTAKCVQLGSTGKYQCVKTTHAGGTFCMSDADCSRPYQDSRICLHNICVPQEGIYGKPCYSARHCSGNFKCNEFKFCVGSS